LRLFVFFFFSFYHFAVLIAAVIGPPLGLLGGKKLSKEESSRRPIFIMKQLGVVGENLAPSFSLIFFSVFANISGSNKPITVN